MFYVETLALCQRLEIISQELVRGVFENIFLSPRKVLGILVLLQAVPADFEHYYLPLQLLISCLLRCAFNTLHA